MTCNTAAPLPAGVGTPCYVYDLAAVRAADADLRSALPDPSRLYYSLKANPHPDVAGELARLGRWAEVSSTGEIRAALDAGFPRDRVMMTGPAKTLDELQLALGVGVRRFSVDSPAELGRLDRLAETRGLAVEVLLRVNADTAVPGMGLSMTGTASAFGADASWVTAEPHRFRGGKFAPVCGLHLYMGTNIATVDLLAEQFASSLSLAREICAVLQIDPVEIDLGGGFGTPYAVEGERPDLAELRPRLTALLDDALPGWRHAEPLVSFESGRYLVGSAGTLYCTVVDVKPSKGRTFVILDAGINQLGGMSGLRRVPRIVPALLPRSPREGSLERGVVAGPLCTPLDRWSDGVRLPALEPGDVVAVPNVGAYGLTASLLAFLGHPPAAEVVVDSGIPDPHERLAVVSASRLALTRTPLTGESIRPQEEQHARLQLRRDSASASQVPS